MNGSPSHVTSCFVMCSIGRQKACCCDDIDRYNTLRFPNPFPTSCARKKDDCRLSKFLLEVHVSTDVAFRSRPFLVGAPKAANFEFTKCDMFRFSARRSGSPHAERGRLHLSSHDFDHFARSQTELSSNRIERGSILPSHLNNAINICRSE